MKEHPDYKYRPRRKPKTMVQKKTDTGGGSASSGKPVPYSVRDLLPQHESSAPGTGGGSISTSAAGSMPEHQSSAAAAAAAAVAVTKFPRAFFSPYQHHHYPSSFYQQVAKDLSTVAGGGTGSEAAAAGKAVHDLALHALYGSSLYSRAVSLATGWPMMAAATSAAGSNGGGGCPVNCAECGQHAERPAHESSLQPPQPPRPAHESSTPSSTPSPPAQLPPPPLLSTTTGAAAAAVIKRPIALLVKPDRVGGQAGLHAQHVI
ncbi:transcription factor SOX-2-like [Aphis craccivora]|uniref:Transcription factor SOX-2-like n=1 Tax=Aphis craccivora TaxID=307492 RepID=A0A6G0ZLW0_APHCR|nr:transcription factor SOX-2-like [Aphis craccivora]